MSFAIHRQDKPNLDVFDSSLQVPGLRASINHTHFTTNKPHMPSTWENETLTTIGQRIAALLNNIQSRNNPLPCPLRCAFVTSEGLLTGDHVNFEVPIASTQPLFKFIGLHSWPNTPTEFAWQLQLTVDSNKRIFIPYYSSEYRTSTPVDDNEDNVFNVGNRASVEEFIHCINKAHQAYINTHAIIAGIEPDEADDTTPTAVVIKGDSMRVEIRPLSKHSSYLFIEGHTGKLRSMALNHLAALDELAKSSGKKLLAINPSGFAPCSPTTNKTIMVGEIPAYKESPCLLQYVLQSIPEYLLCFFYQFGLYGCGGGKKNCLGGKGCPFMNLPYHSSARFPISGTQIRYAPKRIEIMNYDMIQIAPGAPKDMNIDGIKECLASNNGLMSKKECHDNLKQNKVREDVIDSILNHPNVQAAFLTKYHFHIRTSPMFITTTYNKKYYSDKTVLHHPLGLYHGEFMICITKSGHEISIFNLDGRVALALGGQGAHVSGIGGPCMGTIGGSYHACCEASFQSAPAYSQLDSLVHLLMRYLQTADLQDSWGGKVCNVGMTKLAKEYQVASGIEGTVDEVDE